MTVETRRIVFTGRVQGVGFRATTASIAQNYEVAGYVRNLRDGNVELLATGESATLDDFIAEISRRMNRYIASCVQEIQHNGGESLPGFRIRYS